MKTIIISFLLIFGIAASNHGKPINDIYSLKDPVFPEESYVNDIPFNTWEIAVDAIFEGDEIKLEEEAYVDDISFDTRAIACKYMLRKMIETTGEANINDIPFRTDKIYCEHMAALLTKQYQAEQMVNDLPKGNRLSICTVDNGVSKFYMIKVKSPRQPIFRNRKMDDYNYSIIYPVKLELPEIEFNNEGINNEILVKPGFSL